MHIYPKDGAGKMLLRRFYEKLSANGARMINIHVDIDPEDEKEIDVEMSVSRQPRELAPAR